MSLGSTVSRLRTERHLSQEELAAALGVSRQSISKWETDASVPELEKLIKLSEIFGVTLDELVLEKAPEPAAPSAPVSAERERRFPLRRIVGTILLCFGVLFFFLILLLGGDFLGGLIFASPFLLCGTICLVFSQNLGLWCAWAVFFAVNVYLRFATGVNWRLTLMTFQFEPSMNYMRLAIAWAELIVMVLLSAITVLRFWKKPLNKNGKNPWLLAGGWLLIAVLSLLPIGRGPYANIWILLDWLRLGLLVPTLTGSIRYFRTK